VSGYWIQNPDGTRTPLADDDPLLTKVREAANRGCPGVTVLVWCRMCLFTGDRLAVFVWCRMKPLERDRLEALVWCRMEGSRLVW
jgi:hypothetical protein